MKNYLKSVLNAFEQAVGFQVEQARLVNYQSEKLTGKFVELMPISGASPNRLEIEQLW